MSHPMCPHFASAYIKAALKVLSLDANSPEPLDTPSREAFQALQEQFGTTIYEALKVLDTDTM